MTGLFAETKSFQNVSISLKPRNQIFDHKQQKYIHSVAMRRSPIFVEREKVTERTMASHFCSVVAFGFLLYYGVREMTHICQ